MNNIPSKTMHYSLPAESLASPTPGLASAAKFLDAAAMLPNSLIGEGSDEETFVDEVSAEDERDAAEC